MRRIACLAVPILLGSLSLAGCDRTPQADASNVVDSVVSRDVALDRFRAGLPRVDSLSGGMRSRDALVRTFIEALEQRDTNTLRSLVMTKAEYGWIYYPTNPQGLPPYDLSAGLYWFMIEGHSAPGLAHALQERGGMPLHLAGYSCDATPSVEGDNRIWGPCLVWRVQAPGDTVSERLFGPILERAGRFKFVSYANKL